MSESSSDEPQSTRYISVSKAVQLIPKSFKGNPLELREFIQNVEATYEVVDPQITACYLNLYALRSEEKPKLNYSLAHICIRGSR
jgi:hypothetical protein